MPDILSCLSIFDCSICIVCCFISRHCSTIWVDLVPMEHCALFLGMWMNPYYILQLYIIWGLFKSILNSRSNLCDKNNEFYSFFSCENKGNSLLAFLTLCFCLLRALLALSDFRLYPHFSFLWPSSLALISHCISECQEMASELKKPNPQIFN